MRRYAEVSFINDFEEFYRTTTERECATTNVPYAVLWILQADEQDMGFDRPRNLIRRVGGILNDGGTQRAVSRYCDILRVG